MIRAAIGRDGIIKAQGFSKFAGFSLKRRSAEPCHITIAGGRPTRGFLKTLRHGFEIGALGLGGLAIALLLVLVSLLQRLRLAAGFGLPQLPA